MIVRVGIGRKSHRFLPDDSSKLCKIGGILFKTVPGFLSPSDGDVVLQAICNAISSLTGTPILGGIATELCKKDGITDSGVYLQKALETLGPQKISHVAISIEGKRPCFQDRIDEMRMVVAQLLKIEIKKVGITVSLGYGLSDVGCGDGLECFCNLTTSEK